MRVFISLSSSIDGYEMGNRAYRSFLESLCWPQSFEGSRSFLPPGTLSFANQEHAARFWIRWPRCRTWLLELSGFLPTLSYEQESLLHTRGMATRPLTPARAVAIRARLEC